MRTVCLLCGDFDGGCPVLPGPKGCRVRKKRRSVQDGSSAKESEGKSFFFCRLRSRCSGKSGGERLRISEGGTPVPLCGFWNDPVGCCTGSYAETELIGKDAFAHMAEALV